MGYIPDSDSLFDSWAKVYCDYVDAHADIIGVSHVQRDALVAAHTSWDESFDLANSAQAAAKAAIEKKDSDRASFENIIRELTAQIQANPNVTNEQRASLGITVRKETKTPAPIPKTRPVAKIDANERLQQTIHFTDEATPTSKAKPAGVMGCELWVKIGGAPPLDASETSFVATDTKSPYVAHFNGSDGGKLAHWMLRWVNTRGEAGPWSETVSVTIGA